MKMFFFKCLRFCFMNVFFIKTVFKPQKMSGSSAKPGDVLLLPSLGCTLLSISSYENAAFDWA